MAYQSNLLASLVIIGKMGHLRRKKKQKTEEILKGVRFLEYEKPLDYFQDLVDTKTPVYMPRGATVVNELRLSPFKVERDIYNLALEKDTFYQYK